MAVTQNPHIGRSKNAFATAVFTTWKPSYVWARAIFIVIAKKNYHSDKYIASFLNKDSTSIINARDAAHKHLSETDYKNYGGRGVKICDKWLTFKGFIEDMGLTASRPLYSLCQNYRLA